MKFLADLHVHTDYDEAIGLKHGERPDLIARAIADSPLDVVAITEHNRVTPRCMDVQAEVERLTEGTGQEVSVLLGCEFSTRFQGDMYHAGYVFEPNGFHRGNLPAIPDANCNIEDLQVLKKAHPGVVLLFHPTWQDGRSNRPSVTADLMGSGLVDGVELLNGSCFGSIDRMRKGFSPKLRKAEKSLCNVDSGFEMYLQARKRLRDGGKALAAIGNSDAHKENIVGMMATEFRGADVDDLFQAIRNGDTKAVCLVNGGIRNMVNALIGKKGRNRFARTT